MLSSFSRRWALTSTSETTHWLQYWILSSHQCGHCAHSLHLPLLFQGKERPRRQDRKQHQALMPKSMLPPESQTYWLGLNSVTVKTVTLITLCYLSSNRVFAEAPKIRREHTANTMVTTWHGKSRSLRLPHRLAAIVTTVIQMAPKHSSYLPSRNVSLD